MSKQATDPTTALVACAEWLREQWMTPWADALDAAARTLREQAEQAERQATIINGMTETIQRLREGWTTERQQQADTLATVRAALAKYGSHLDSCGIMFGDDTCSCGLKALTTSEGSEQG